MCTRIVIIDAPVRWIARCYGTLGFRSSADLSRARSLRTLFQEFRTQCVVEQGLLAVRT